MRADFDPSRYKNEEALRQENEMSWGCLNEIRCTLSALDKKHPNSGDSTPPMFYREWILCVVNQERDAIKGLKGAAQKVLAGLDSYLDECGYGADGVSWGTDADDLRAFLKDCDEVAP